MMRSPSPWSCSSPELIKPEPTTPDSSPPESNYITDYPLCSPISDTKHFDEPTIAILPPLSGPLSPATVIQSHYRQRLTKLVGQLATALSSLPPLVPAGPPNCPGFDRFGSLMASAKPGARGFGPVRAVLCQVWAVPGGIRIEHITRGAQGTTVVLNLIERVGCDGLSRLGDDEREEAVAWVRALRDAATERSRYAEVEASQPLFEEDSPPADSSLAIAPEQTWLQPTHRFTPKSYSSLYDLNAYDLPPSTYDDDDDGASDASFASSTSSTESSGFRPPRVSCAPRHLSYPDRDNRPPAAKRIKLIGAHLGSLGHHQVKRLSNNPTGMPRSASAPTLAGAKPNPPTARVASRNATRAVAPTPKPQATRPPAVPRTVPLPPVAMPILPPRPSLSGRAQRVRKMPTWLSDAAELPPGPTTPPPVAEPKPAPVVAPAATAQPPTRDRERRAARHRGEDEPEAEDESRFKPETAVLARQPFGWWPSVVLNPKDAPPETVGTWEPKAYLIKSIPTGGDWRWLPPHLVEPFPLELCRQLLADDLPNESRFKAKSWREYRADLEDAARIISDPMRLQKWLSRKTAAERGLASGKGRK